MYDMYGPYSTSPSVSGQVMMNSAYSPINGAVIPFQQTSSNAFGQYAGNSNYSVNQYQNGQAGPSTPQFVHSALGSPSLPPYSTPQFSNATAYPHMPSPQLQPAQQQTARTIYMGNVPPDTHVSEVLDLIKSGVIDSVRPLPEKKCIFVTFVEPSAAAHFYHEATTKRLSVNGAELKVGWGKSSSIPSNIQLALQNGATRNVFLGSLDEAMTEQDIRENLARFGHIEHVKMIKDKSIAFVHFLSTSNAVKCVNTLPTESAWASRRVNYGKDRCAPSTKVHNPSAQHVYTSAGYPGPAYQVRYPSISYDPYTGAAVEAYPNHPVASPASGSAMYAANMSLSGLANRTIYLGNIHPDTACEEICNVIRGGILSQIRYMPDKHIAFAAFVDPALALHFYNQAMYQGIVIKNRRLKVGWGKPSALPAAVIAAVQNGGSRNVYLGNIDETITEEKLKQDFSDYGEIELVNTLKEKNCAFVNFTSIAAAVRAIDGIRSKEEYKKFRINYGKDRCGNPPRTHKTVHHSQQDAEVNVAATTLSDISPQSQSSPRPQSPQLSRTSLVMEEGQETVNSVLLDSVLVGNG
ncbi:hypothetical protein EC973_004366 [Apophysomyces ossiformis]|uniref:RRM domain-containing protein n=1 Tax=Apophysomyces ossiformis TaxID=679940 RepID=A0A8H7BG03_9FUNG|nr:hypothetical protein EC973_004366 [Apophysomyces ossiformis]